MSVKLEKGQGVSLKKYAPNLKRILVGLGWDPVRRGIFSNPVDIDIDASIICINEEGKKEDVIYYGNLEHRSGAIKHHGDNLTGRGDGDDEQIEIQLDKIPANISKLAVIINIYRAYQRKQHFGKVKNCYIQVTDLDANKELLYYDVSGNYNGKTGIFVADLYRYNGDWKFRALGEGVEVTNIMQMVQMKCN